MLEEGLRLRRVEAFECLGGRVEMLDVAELLRDAGPEPTQLLHAAGWPPPTEAITLTVRVDATAGGRVHLLKAEIRPGTASGVGPGQPFATSMVAPSVVFVAHGLRLGGPVGAVVAGLVVYGAHRLRYAVRPQQPDVDAAAAPPVEVEDRAAGIRARVTCEGRVIVLRAAVPSADVHSGHVRAFFGLVLRVAQHHAGRPADVSFLAGRRYRLSRDPDGWWDDPADQGAVTLGHVGGLTDVVDQLREVALSFKHPAVMARWGARRPQGILMYGPPGTGKTMLAQALANEIGATMREIRTPEILNKYIGESERNIKQIFEEARLATEPTVLFFDEFDSIISYTGAGFDGASQVFNGVAGIFKQEMNTLVEENPNVIVVATTNFPERVDRSLIRSGRFDVKIAVPAPDRAARADILTKIIRSLIGRHEVSGFRMFDDDVDVAELAELTAGMTGADLKEVLRRIQLAKAMAEVRGRRPAGPITQDDLRRGIADLRR